MPAVITAGIKAGIRTGIRSGITAGIYADSGPAADRDATSNIYVPSSAAQFTALGIATPSHLWLLQEASGSPADSIGSCTLAPTNSPLYQQTVTGWTRKGVGFNQTANQRLAAAGGVGPGVGTTSVLWLGYVRVTAAPAAVRTILGPNISGTSPCRVDITTTPAARANINGTLTTGSSNMSGAGVQPVAILLDRTNSRAVVYTGQEKITGTYSAGVADGAKGLGSSGSTSFPGECVWMTAWTGAAAELSDAQVKTLLQTLGWTIPWS